MKAAFPQSSIQLNSRLDTVKAMFDKQRLFFDDGNTRSYTFRKTALLNLKRVIKAHEGALLEAMYLDYKKPKMEAFLGDVGVVLDELDFAIRHLKYWMQSERVTTPITLMPGKSKVIKEPKGVVVIFAPWNYPFNLAITPLIGAVAAGNCVFLKPAHETPHTSMVTEKIIREAFQPEHVTTVTGVGSEIGQLLLENLVFNHIFFTGSANTGKWIMEKAAKNLTPVTLELGGKCPAIIDRTARINTITQRIVWGKLFNAGQTCLAVDYVLVHEDLKSAFITKFKQEIESRYGRDIAQSPDYSRLVNQERTKKIVSLIEGENIIYGGQFDIENCYIAPTIIEVDNLDSPIMKEEIFGPILPVITWKEEREIVEIVRRNRYPLACYVFSENKIFIDYIHQNIEFGGGCINNTIVHYANPHFGFGGVMSSGFGKYHGEQSFDTFSNAKPVLSSASMIDVHIWNPPYTDLKYNMIKKFLG